MFCFPLLAIINSSCIKIYVQVLFKYSFSILWGTYLGAGLLSYTAALCLIYWKLANCLYYLTIPLSMYEDSNYSTFLTILDIIVIFMLTIIGPTNKIFFNLHSYKNNNETKYSFKCAYWPLNTMFRKIFIQIFCPCFNRVIWFLKNYKCYLYILKANFLSYIWSENIFFPFCGLNFIFLKEFFEVFFKFSNFNKIRLIYIFSYFLVHLDMCHFQKPLLNWRHQRLIIMFSFRVL